MMFLVYRKSRTRRRITLETLFIGNRLLTGAKGIHVTRGKQDLLTHFAKTISFNTRSTTKDAFVVMVFTALMISVLAPGIVLAEDTAGVDGGELHCYVGALGIALVVLSLAGRVPQLGPFWKS